MPTVPTYRAGRVGEAAVPNVRVNPNAAPIEAFGGGQGLENVNRAANNLQDQLLEFKRNADQVAVTEADDKATRLRNTMFYDPKTGAMTKKGKDSFGLMDTYGSEYNKQLDDIENSLSNDAQKAMFRRKATQQKSDFDMLLQKHVLAESQAFDEQTSKSRVASAQNDAVLNYQDPSLVAQSISTQQETIMEAARRNGVAPETAALMVKDSVSKTHSAIIDRMLGNGDDLDASAYYKNNKDQFMGDDIARVEKNLEEGSLRGESMRRSDAIMAKGMAMPQALEEARKIEDPKVRDATVSRLKDEYQMKRLAKEQAQSDVFDTAANIMERNRGQLNEAGLPVPATMWGQLDLQGRNAIDSRAKQLREGKNATTDWEEYYNLKSMASSSATRDEFLKINLMIYRPKMADAEFKQLVDLQTSLRKGDEKQLNGYRTTNQIVSQTLRSIGVNPNPKPGSNDAQKAAQFQRLVDEQYQMMQDETGKKPTSADVQKIVDNLVVKGEVPDTGWFWNDKKRVFELQEGESLMVNVEDIPKSDRQGIEKALATNHIPVTPENIEKAYQTLVKARSARANQ